MPNLNQDQNHDDTAGRAPDRVLTSEDLAHPAPADGSEGAHGAGREAVPVPRDVTQQNVPKDLSKDLPKDLPKDVPKDVRESQPAEAVAAPRTEGEPLMGTAGAERYRARWGEIQGRFVDDPQEAVRAADTLMAEVIQTFADTLSEHRSGLGKQWDRGEQQVATEDLRQTLQAYRSQVNRLLDI
ncbi:hypothetical protein [Streptomyces sp. NPDC058401]|uniref:hypothetical protein n=1 Tax=Streptomyces sp. NPDC058401 TaxID=3346480 RepID=UPI003668C13A